MGEDGGKYAAITFDDAWRLWADTEAHYGLTIQGFIHPARRLPSGQLYAARVALQATTKVGKRSKDVATYCAVGGARGARTVPAALVRALSELAARLEELQADSVAQAQF